MAAAPQNLDALHHHAFMHADRFEPGRLANHSHTAQRATRFGQCPGAGHGGFFVARGQNQQRLLERLIEQRPDGFDDQREKTLHVTAAQSDPAVIHFCQLERIGLPQGFIVRHRVAVACQHQPAGAAAITGE